MSFAFFPLELLLLLKITLTGEFLQNFNLLEAKVNSARHSYRVYNHAVHKQVYKLISLISSVYVHARVFKPSQLFSLEINVLYNLMLNMGMFT